MYKQVIYWMELIKIYYETNIRFENAFKSIYSRFQFTHLKKLFHLLISPVTNIMVNIIT